MLALWLSLAQAGPLPIVAVGDGLVAGPAASEAGAEPASSWVAGLGDCLSEGAPGRYAVVDRVRARETAVTAMQVVDKARAAKPKLVVVGVGAQEAIAGGDVAQFSAELGQLVEALKDSRKPAGLVLVGVVPASAEDQDALDARIASWNEAIATTATSHGAVHVDLWKDWPREAAERSALTGPGYSLTDQGHARVAAAVCDAVLSWKDGPEETP